VRAAAAVPVARARLTCAALLLLLTLAARLDHVAAKAGGAVRKVVGAALAQPVAGLAAALRTWTGHAEEEEEEEGSDTTQKVAGLSHESHQRGDGSHAKNMEINPSLDEILPAQRRRTVVGHCALSGKGSEHDAAMAGARENGLAPPARLDIGIWDAAPRARCVITALSLMMITSLFTSHMSHISSF
jgi:hypothetical protein